MGRGNSQSMNAGLTGCVCDRCTIYHIAHAVSPSAPTQHLPTTPPSCAAIGPRGESEPSDWAVPPPGTCWQLSGGTVFGARAETRSSQTRADRRTVNVVVCVCVNSLALRLVYYFFSSLSVYQCCVLYGRESVNGLRRQDVRNRKHHHHDAEIVPHQEEKLQ